MRQIRDTSIQSTINGGLNINATPQSIELTDATVLLNADPLQGGGIRKRPGTRVLYRDRNGRYGVGGTTITTPRRNSFIVMKEGTSLSVYLEESSRLLRVVTKSNVFRTESLRLKPFAFSFQDTAARAIFLLPNNAPTQLSAYEYVNVSSLSDSSITFSNTTSMNGAPSSGVVLIGNGYAVNYSTVSYNGTTNATTLTGVFDTTATYHLIVFTWQWWGEAIEYSGDAFYKASTRLNSSASTDLNVPIPESVRTSIDVTGNMTRFPILAYSTSNPASNTYTYSASPNSATTYAFSDGTVNNVVNPTPFWITFGALSGSNPFAIHLIRLRELPFNANTGAAPDNLLVYINETTQVLNSTTTFASWQTYSSSYSVTTGTTKSKYIAFDRGNPLGIASTYSVLIVNKEKTFTGSGSNSNLWMPTNNADGTVYAVPGLGLYADYLNGRFPTFGTLFEERMVLGGFPDTTRVVFSALYGFRSTVRPYTFFQTTSEYVSESDAIDLVVSVNAGEYGTALTKWNNGLYYFTNRSVSRVYRRDGEYVATSELENVGALNPHSVVTTSQGLYFLYSDGLYTVVPLNYNNDYKTNLLSQKITPVFQVLRDSTEYHSTAWISFDSTTNKVFVGIGEESLKRDYSHRLYVLHLDSGGWSEYYTYGYFRTYDAVMSTKQFYLFVSTQNNEAQEPVTYVAIRFESYGLTVDFVDYITTTEEDEIVYPITPLAGVEHTTTNTQREYAVSGKQTRNLGGFDFLPLTFVNDIFVSLNDVPLVFNTDYIKLQNGNIWLLNAPTSGLTLKVFPRGVY